MLQDLSRGQHGELILNTVHFEKNVIKEKVLDILSKVYDPEIPVLNIVELGIVNEIKCNNDKIEIDLIPTYSGCPAMYVIEEEVRNSLHSNGFINVNIHRSYSKVWTTDLISDDTKRKLEEYGIAPPEGIAEKDFKKDSFNKPVKCPYCKSMNTKLINAFGSTLCKSLHSCLDCSQPFEAFKCI